MNTHPGMLLAYSESGEIVGTLDYLVKYGEDGAPLGLVDFAATEDAGVPLTQVWNVQGAAGSGSWPEYLGARAHEYRAELAAHGERPKITALVHKASGHRRDRAGIEAAIQARIDAAHGQPADIRDLVGGPDRPLQIDAEGKTSPRQPAQPSALPVVRARPI